VILTKEDFLTHEDIQPVSNWLDRANWTYGWHSDKRQPFGHWNVDITRTGIHNTTDISGRLPKPFRPVWRKINALYGDQGVLVRCYANQHTYGVEGYIHTDTEREQDFTAILYLNREWDANWGGETTFYNLERTEILTSVLPKLGRMVVFPGSIPHCARGLTRICPRSRTTLMFKFAIDPKVAFPAEELLRNFLTKIGAHQKPHKEGSLMDHLIRVFHLMKSVGIGDILALAGGLHSVYGTQAYKNACLQWENNEISKLFGAETDRLVRLFSRLNRPQDLLDGSNLPEQDLFLMRCIEVANLYDQNELEQHPQLLAFAAQFK
jgi:hypothetical protein